MKIVAAEISLINSVPVLINSLEYKRPGVDIVEDASIVGCM